LDDREVGRYWEENAEVWTRLSRMGADIYRDHFNTPAFLDILPEVKGLVGLDIGCGEGYNTRKVAELGARMTAVDIAPTFIKHAQEKEEARPLGITYVVASGLDLPFEDLLFDFAVAFMSLMDMADHEKALGEAYRVIKPGGFLQFSITHPCFDTPHRKWVDDEHGNHIAMEVSGYFGQRKGILEEWIFHQTPAELKARLPKFKTPRFHRTLSSWLNLVIDTGFAIEQLAEPTASDEVIAKVPHLADTRIISHFLIVRCRKSKG
jgi:ubiquinone/menaquinone biosynthesis C-methylase UbiE